jgi:hypothetical protein
LLVEGDRAAVGDSNAVGVARQIGQHRLRSAERTLCVDDPFGLAQWGEISREALRRGEMGVVAEEAQAAGVALRDELQRVIAACSRGTGCRMPSDRGSCRPK